MHMYFHVCIFSLPFHSCTHVYSGEPEQTSTSPHNRCTVCFMGGAGVQRSMEELHVHVHCVIQELESAVRREENTG